MALRYLAPNPNPRQVSENVNAMLKGVLNNTGQATLTASSTTTTVTEPNVHSGSKIFLTPRTANASSIIASLYISDVSNGSFTITHASDANTDKTFDYVYFG